jgi:hypothetical protein
MSYSTLRNKQTQLIRKARDGSVFIGDYATTAALTTLTTGGANEVQTVTITGAPTGGTFTLSFAGQTTAGIAYNAVASAVQTALVALSTIGAGNVAVTGGPGPTTPYVVTFQGSLASMNVAQMTATGSFTGGAAPAVAVTTTTPGVAPDLSPLPTGMTDLGWTSTDGTTFARSTDISNVSSFGSVEPTRSDVTRDTITMAATAQETKLLSIGLYTGADATAIVPTAGTGEVKVLKPARPGFKYYRVLGLYVDDGDAGEIWMGRYLPRARVTEFGEQKFTDGDDPISYPVTFTGYEDSVLGFSHCWYFGGPGWLDLLHEMGFPGY